MPAAQALVAYSLIYGNEYFEVKAEAAIGLPKSEELMQARAA